MASVGEKVAATCVNRSGTPAKGHATLILPFGVQTESERTLFSMEREKPSSWLLLLKRSCLRDVSVGRNHAAKVAVEFVSLPIMSARIRTLWSRSMRRASPTFPGVRLAFRMPSGCFDTASTGWGPSIGARNRRPWRSSRSRPSRASRRTCTTSSPLMVILPVFRNRRIASRQKAAAANLRRRKRTFTSASPPRIGNANECPRDGRGTG